jgi:Rieske 2Fe-2S family protein
MYANTRPDMPEGVTTLPARYYTDPSHFQLEMERIHFDMWLCAGRTEQVAAPGRYFLRQVGRKRRGARGRRRTRVRLP